MMMKQNMTRILVVENVTDAKLPVEKYMSTVIGRMQAFEVLTSTTGMQFFPTHTTRSPRS